jgi:hypothetical protein
MHRLVHAVLKSDKNNLHTQLFVFFEVLKQLTRAGFSTEIKLFATFMLELKAFKFLNIFKGFE